MSFIVNDNSVYKQILDEYKLVERAKIHCFHRYYGKLIPAIPDAYINIFSDEQDLIFDPFAGSGTTAVESLKNNRNFVGVEINPLSKEIAYIKTRRLDVECLRKLNERIIQELELTKNHYGEENRPYLLNRDHWFKDFVQDDLLCISDVIEKVFQDIVPVDLEHRDDYKKFYQIALSAIIKNVSNADTMHVFPGVSKRMRRLEAEGAIHIDVRKSYERAIKSRAEAFSIFADSNANAEIILGDSTELDLSNYKNKVSLIVTNPPYISSVRYIETLKLEMYWLEYITSQKDYTSLSRKMLGNDHIPKKEWEEIGLVGYDEVDDVIEKFKCIDTKSAKIIYDFFYNMEKVIKKMNYVLKKGGRVVIKISDSKIKKIAVETGKLMTAIAEKNGFNCVDVFLDEINNNSRSLLTARNSYSDIITHDYIVIWEKLYDI